MNTLSLIKKIQNKIVEYDSVGRITFEYFKNEKGNFHGKHKTYNYQRSKGGDLRNIFEVNYVDGVKQGLLKTFDGSGNLFEEVEYKDGVENGIIRQYSTNGILNFDGHQKRIRNKFYFHGPYEKYYKNGTIKEKGKMSMGKRIHECVFYNTNGEIKAIKDFARGGKLKRNVVYDKFSTIEKIVKNPKSPYSEVNVIFKLNKDEIKPYLREIIKEGKTKQILNTQKEYNFYVNYKIAKEEFIIVRFERFANYNKIKTKVTIEHYITDSLRNILFESSCLIEDNRITHKDRYNLDVRRGL